MRIDPGRCAGLWALAGVLLAQTGCAHPAAAPAAHAAAPTLTGDAAHPGETRGWVRTELYFGLGPADRPDEGIREADWRAFLDREVTPRFPAGLSVEDAYGQWLSKGETEPSRLRSKVLIILSPGTEENRAKIDAIRSAWKEKTGHQSVLRSSQPADVSF